MDRLHAPGRDERLPQKHEEAEHRCILCDVVIEIAEHDIYFVTGHCRHCHEALEEE